MVFYIRNLQGTNESHRYICRVLLSLYYIVCAKYCRLCSRHSTTLRGWILPTALWGSHHYLLQWLRELWDRNFEGCTAILMFLFGLLLAGY